MLGAGPAGAPRRRLAGKGPAAKTAKTVLKKPAVRRKPAAAAGEGEAGPPLPPAVVLNLERRQDRWDAVGRRLEPLGLRFRRWAAVDGVASSPAAISTDLVALRWSTARNWEYVVKVFEGGKQCGYEPKELPLTGGERGCAASHAAVWRHVAEGVHGGGPLVVLEDDAKPTPAFASRLPQALAALREEEPDVLFLGYTQAAPWRRKVGAAVREAEYLWTTVGYVLWPAGARKLLEALPIDQPVDNFISNLMRLGTLRGFAVVPAILKQAEAWNVNNDVAHSDDAAWKQNCAA